MSDTIHFIVVITVALVLILGAAYAMDRRHKSTTKEKTQVPPGPVSRVVLWISYVILAVAFLCVVGAFVFQEMLFINLTSGFMAVYIIDGIIYRIVRPRGM